MLRKLRKRIEKSEFLAARVASVAGRYLSFCDRTTKWQTEGLDELEAALSDGPVLLLMWHSRSVMAILHWPLHAGPISTLYDRSPVGRVSGALQRRMGLNAIEMSHKLSNRAASRTILKRVKDGIAIGMTGDGPLGPALALKDAPLEWARVTDMPVFCYAFATTRGRRLDTWDQMLIPKPYGKGAKVFRRFHMAVPRKPDNEAKDLLRQNLSKHLQQTTARADQLLGFDAQP